MLLPSKELVEKVLYYSLDSNNIKKIERYLNNLVISKKNNDTLYEINIYEFAFKAKDWIKKQGYVVCSCQYPEPDIGCNCIIEPEESYYIKHYNFEANTEIEAIIKTGEWVLNQIKEDNK